MNLAEKEIKIFQQKFSLTNQRAIYWKNKKTLILSDLHLGKAAHFRKNGIALPVQLIQKDLQRLSNLINHYAALEIIIVGDFLHAEKNSEFQLFQDWKTQFPDLTITLIRGNHDRISEKHCKDLGISKIHHQLRLEKLIFSHDMIKDTNEFVISGHIHPGIRMKSSILKNLKFPCYIKTDNQLILPAFSSFTGLDTKNHPQNASYYIFTDNSIYEL